MVVVGGVSVKFGMNVKDYVKKGFFVFEDVVGGFVVFVFENDGVNLVIRIDLIGKYIVGIGFLL